MKIFVINLERDIARRVSIQKQFNQLQLPFEFSSGILGSALTSQQKSEWYNDKKAHRHQCRSLVTAEIGCALSHIEIYRKIIENNISAACILEDDVILPKDFKTNLTQIENTINDTVPKVILLSQAVSYKNSSVKLNHKYSLNKYKNGFYTSSYIVNLQAAKALFKVLFPVNDVADCWKRLNRHKVVELLAINPPLVFQDQDSFGSSTTIGINLAAKKVFISKIKFKFCRLIWLSYDLIVAYYDRNFRPYGGILKRKY